MERLYESFGLAEWETKKSTVIETLNLLLLIMSYHGTGNVSTLTATVASSGLLDPWSVFIAMAEALSGMNHGGAAQMGALQLFNLQEMFPGGYSEEQLTEEAFNRVVKRGDPGWCVGHRVLRGDNEDPRMVAQRQLLTDRFAESLHHKLAIMWYKALTDVLDENTGAEYAKQNVDSLTAVSLYELGLVTNKGQEAFAVIIFALSRWAGAGAEVFWKAVQKGGRGSVNGSAVRPALFRPSVYQQ